MADSSSRLLPVDSAVEPGDRFSVGAGAAAGEVVLPESVAGLSLSVDALEDENGRALG
jgi:hypothetical protein